jgi:hypothetical protein
MKSKVNLQNPRRGCNLTGGIRLGLAKKIKQNKTNSFRNEKESKSIKPKKMLQRVLGSWIRMFLGLQDP